MSPLAREDLLGVRVGMLEARMATEMSDLVRRRGAVVRSAPAVAEAAVDCGGLVGELLDRLSTRKRRIYVFLTGAGATTLFAEADRQGRLGVLLDSLRDSVVVSRGAKPATALRRYGVVASLTVPSPYTSKEVLGSLPYDLSGTEVTLVHYGERNAILANALGSRGAMVVDLCVYEWQLPADLEPLRDMVVAIVHREVDAVVFTSQVQWKHLLHVAHDGRLAGSMIAALRSDVVVAAVGPVCAAALAESGVHPHVVPSNPKMGPLVAELANYFAMRQRPGAQPPVQVHSGGG